MTDEYLLPTRSRALIWAIVILSELCSSISTIPELLRDKEGLGFKENESVIKGRENDNKRERKKK